jgi:hypothetical protein
MDALALKEPLNGKKTRGTGRYTSSFPDTAPGPLDLNQSTTSVSMRNEILRLRERFQRDSAPVLCQ